MTPLRLRHCFTHYRSLGGVQSMLQRHLQGDGDCGLNSDCVAYFDPRDAGEERVVGLGLRWHHNFSQARGRWRQRVPPHGGLAAYHNCWGMAGFADLDGAGRRLGVLHSDWPGLPRQVAGLRPHADGLLCVSHPLLRMVGDVWRGFPSERLGFLPYPVRVPPHPPAQRPRGGRPLVLGYCGRLVSEQKRVERLPVLAAHLEQAGVAHEWEVLGEGPELPRLRAATRDRPHWRFLGRQSGSAYWAPLERWDFIVFVSDFEGLPIALLEALSVGVIPLMPAIGSGADEYLRAIDAGLLYPPLDWPAAVRQVQRCGALPEPALAKLRAAGVEVTRPHWGDAYLRTFASFAAGLAALPRLSACPPPARRWRSADLWPFALLRRWRPDAIFQ